MCLNYALTLIITLNNVLDSIILYKIPIAVKGGMSTRKKLVEPRHSIYRWIGNNEENSLQQKKFEKVSRVTKKFLHLSILEVGHYRSPDRPNRVKLCLLVPLNKFWELSILDFSFCL